MADVTVHRHGDRWAVREGGAESPVKEFPTREAAELAARQMAGGGEVEVLDEDPTSLEHIEPRDAGRPERADQAATRGPGAAEGVRERQAGL
jgi:uncharacterized protein DUF2188